MFASIWKTIKSSVYFQGRSSRREFWFYVLGVIFLAVIAYFLRSELIRLSFLLTGTADTALLKQLLYFPLDWIFMLPIPALVVRRLHDQDLTGWWMPPILSITLVFIYSFIVNVINFISAFIVFLLFFPISLFIGVLLGYTPQEVLAFLYHTDNSSTLIDIELFSIFGISLLLFTLCLWIMSRKGSLGQNRFG